MAYVAGLLAILNRGTSVGGAIVAPGSDTFTAVPLIANLKIPDDARTVNTFKTLDSASPRSLGGSFEARVITFRLVFDFANATHLSMKAASSSSPASSYVRNWQIIMPDSGAFKIDYVGYISKWSWEELDNEKEIAASVEIAVDGTPVETP